MALPTSRDQTVNDSDVVPGSLYNAIQDCIIGKKHGWLWRSLPAPLWQQRVTDGGSTLAADLRWDSVGSIVMQCGLDLDVGTTIRELKVSFEDANIGPITVNLAKRNLATGAAAVTTQLYNNAAQPAGFHSVSITDFDAAGGTQPLLIEADFQYVIEFIGANGTTFLHGARFEHARL